MAQGPKIVELDDKFGPSKVITSADMADGDAHAKEAKGNVVSRNTPILIQRDPNGQVGGLFLEPKEFGSDGTSKANRKIDNGEIRVYRPPAQPKGQKRPPSTARLAPPAVQPEAAVPEAVAIPEPGNELMAQAEPEATPEAALRAENAIPMTRPAPKTKVQMSGAGLAKMTVYFAEVWISETLVVLGFSDDGESAVIEPPAAGQENPLTLIIAGKSYTCISGEFSFRRGEMMFLVLIRLDSV